MEAPDGRSLERVVSQKALQMSSSWACQLCVLGFLCGVCVTSLFMAASLGIGNAAPFPFSLFSVDDNNLGEEHITYSEKDNTIISASDDNISSLWSQLLHQSKDKVGPHHPRKIISSESSNVPKAPHLEDCKSSFHVNRNLDMRIPNRTYPPWTLWKGTLDSVRKSANDEQLDSYTDRIVSEGAYPPWVIGSDEENYPLTRKVQRDLWLHQHPANCNDPSVKFLLADWEKLPGFGIGAQLAGMCGLLAIAINEKRVLVTGYYNRADHDGCKGSSRSSWSCYFFPETSLECKKRAYELMQDKTAWQTGVITGKENYTSKDIWSGRIPRVWGSPWSIMQPTTEINGTLIVRHRKMDRRWWRAQAIRYLMRFQTEYTCNIMNEARHSAFGREAAKMVLESSSENMQKNEHYDDMEKFVWSNHKPWVPRPLLSIHVRMGDKGCEMTVFGFEEYMRLANKIRTRFPHLKNVWLSTEMQDVIDRSKLYGRHWKFYYTNVTRQTGNMLMAAYESSLGRETSSNYPLVNFLMATEADFFIGALGSTWCFLIDGMRSTGGKVMSGYLSVNKDRFW
ncbi:alpha-(1 6)-fucosyltransferase [Striga asiatica]|uniref:Alpha-(1 6)-fucosyltransferase n=1 Tax=Striga asiatica TaxID=4170 RepID=A0A5A7PQ75_STRAF|nr:alpha-(1 6)-fucosyltransferase [Striga asiatica]